MNLLTFISAIDISPQVAKAIDIIRIIAMVLLLVFSIALIIFILFQPSTSSGMGAMAGQSTETFYSKNKGKSLAGIMKRLTVILAIGILVLTVLYLVLSIFLV